MKLLMPAVICLMASCAGKSTMMVTSRNSQGVTVSADWRQHAGYATNSAGSARRWFAKQALKLAQTEGQPVSAVRLQGATLKYQDFPGVCIATLHGTALFGEPNSGGVAFHDGSSLMAQAVSEDRRIQKKLLAHGAFNGGTTAENARSLAMTARAGHQTRMHMMSMPQYTSRTITSGVPEAPRKTDAGRGAGLVSRSGRSPGNTRDRGDTWPNTRQGGATVSSTGAASMKDGDTWSHSKGVTSTRKGNVVYNSDGTSYTISADGTMYLNSGN